MSDVNLKDLGKAADLGASNVSAASKTLQAFATEVSEMSRESIEHASDAIEKLHNARGLSEVLAIQTAYMREAFEHFSQHTRKFSELMASFPLEMSKSCTDAWTTSLNTAVKTTEDAREKMTANVERLSQTYRNP